MLRACPAIERRIIVTPDRAVAGLPHLPDRDVLIEPAPVDLNGAVRLGLALAASAGAARVLVVPGDVPLVTTAEIASILACPADVVIVPSHDRRGTNALLLPPSGPLAPHFGIDSFERHRQLAEAAGLGVRILPLEGLGRDIDQPGDLAPLARLDRYAWLADVVATSLV